MFCYHGPVYEIFRYLSHQRVAKAQASLHRLARAFTARLHEVWMQMKSKTKIFISRHHGRLLQAFAHYDLVDIARIESKSSLAIFHHRNQS